MSKHKAYRLKNIVWDTDDEDEVELPAEMTLEIEGSGLEELDEGQLEDYGFADWLTDKTGWCVSTFDWEPLLTKVRFLKETIEGKDGKTVFAGDVVAVFPDTEKDCRPGFVMTYEHVGQHSEASLEYVDSLKPAPPEEYADLKRELEESVGYELEVLP